ncbi:hypothetical protein GSB9_03045 [Flavobacteriaceae bacterium GSB9]|nr:hypothetical protein GSB9_03045 [Flavobacteriaceae bacterium GSB9]
MADNIQRVRIDFTMPNGYVRHLLLGFTLDDTATDGVDYGYDALNIDSFPDDLNWIIEDKRYVIQGVGSFDDTKKYPLGLFLGNSGDIKIDLDTTTGFENPINVYVFDALLNTYTNINNASYSNAFEKGEYLDRFYIAFKANTTNDVANKNLSTTDAILRNTKIQYLRNFKELLIDTNNGVKISDINISNSLGQKLHTIKNVNSNRTKIPVQQISTNRIFVTVETELGQITKQILLL